MLLMKVVDQYTEVCILLNNGILDQWNHRIVGFFFIDKIQAQSLKHMYHYTFTMDLFFSRINFREKTLANLWLKEKSKYMFMTLNTHF